MPVILTEPSPDNVHSAEDALRAVALEAAQEAWTELQGDGLSPEEAGHIIVRVLDGILLWRLFLQEPLASALEAADGPALASILSALDLGDLLQRDPAKIEERAQRAEDRGHTRIAARRRARAVRVQARQGEAV